MAILDYWKATMHLILQIGISRDTECVNTVGFQYFIRIAKQKHLGCKKMQGQEEPATKSSDVN